MNLICRIGWHRWLRVSLDFRPRIRRGHLGEPIKTQAHAIVIGRDLCLRCGKEQDLYVGCADAAGNIMLDASGYQAITFNYRTHHGESE